MKLILLATLILTGSSLGAEDQEVIPHRQDKPPNKPYSPPEAIRNMTVPEGFTVELVASEPDIVNPIAMAFDDRGRIWITESIEYPRKSAGPGRDRVKILEDPDSDGRADKVTVFAEGLNIPTGVALGYGGIWVLNAPDLLFMREKDGKEISREVVLTGFGRTDTHELPSSLTWGPDGWLYGLNGVFNQSRVVSGGKEFKFTCAMWRIHPRTREFQIVCEGTSNPYGIAWDSEGSAIVEACHWANDHLFHFVETGYYQRQAGAYPPFTIKIGSITDHGHQKTAYCGIAYFDSDAYPEKYRERIYVGNIHGGCINVDRLHRDGATYLAKAEPDFLSANDVWFMPVSQKVGPDGCLYILDWYDRYHCAQDAGRDPEGIDRLKGRLYRVRYKDSPRASRFDLADESDEQLIERLRSPNIYFRETAQRLLTQRLSIDPRFSAAGSPSDEAQRLDSGSTFQRRLSRIVSSNNVRNLVLNPSAPRKARLHGLWALIGTGSLPPSFHQNLLTNSDPAFRAWGVRAAGNFKTVVPAIREKIVAMASDPSPDVQLQVAIAARKIENFDALPVLVAVLTHCGHDKLMPSIVWPNLHPLLEDQSARFFQLVNQTDFGAAPALVALLPRAVDRMLSSGRIDTLSIAGLIETLASRDVERAKESLSIVSAKLNELSESNQTELKSRIGGFLHIILTGPVDHSLYPSAQLLAAQLKIGSMDAISVRRQFLSTEQPDRARLQALDALIAFKDRSLLGAVSNVLSSGSRQFLTQVLAALGRLDDLKLADVVLGKYQQISAELQPLAIDLLMQREPWAKKLLDAVQSKRLPPSVLNANHLRKIVESNDREALWAVERTWGKIREDRNPEREKVVAEMGKYFAQNPGDPIAGQQAFSKLCAQCHVLYGEGGNVGPDITSNGRASFEQLLSNVFDPSLVIGPAYQITTVVTKDGRNLTGLVTEDNEHRIVLKMPGEGQASVSRNNVKYTRLSKLSMMPEGVESLFDKKELSDLFAFLSLDRPPNDPAARLIPGAPTARRLVASATSGPVSVQSESSGRRMKVEKSERGLIIQTRNNDGAEWVELLTCVTDRSLRPYLHPVRDAAGRVVLTDDRPSDHVWQHGIFTGFHKVNGFNYWKEDEGRQRFVRLLDLKELDDRVMWRSLTELVDPTGRVVLEEEDSIKVYAPDSAESYVIDFDFLLRAKDREVTFGKFAVGGLAIRMPWDQANPRQTHLNSNGLRGRAGEQKRAKWCNVERPFGDQIFGAVIFDHPGNPNHPSGWRVDEQGLINPAISMVGDWSLPAGKEHVYHYRIHIYRGSAAAQDLERKFEEYAKVSFHAQSK